MGEFIASSWLVAAALVAAVAYIVATIKKESKKELEQLAATRGERVIDLEHEVAGLRDRLIRLEAKYDALVDMRTEEIARRVAMYVNGWRDEETP